MNQQQQLQLLAELEVEMMADMYNRMTVACQKKCIAPTYKEGDLSKGEAVCLDRCVAKYLEVHESIGKKLTEKSAQDEATMKQMQGQS
ncbi:mitochondrial import inner membrane translocase subunit Tim10-B [Strongylocentrotus purpuratus]|uniref:Mitochondrial import inner membrane translocase subunit n=1 Tax=Strongylocentrotus purpuratus TaxID=7668 RepID=A0A7M7RGI6_STRPU|nr:mitochondrial import inner membrane translocase subunit Tim10-B [Strongylocentrotus purpuratus]|eukprot:XP_011672625.1 PREDICTED: mitochondrial import inner membrane translocase subunit Tim10-B-like isoform X2 [Strongylocentrotus purpuratus]